MPRIAVGAGPGWERSCVGVSQENNHPPQPRGAPGGGGAGPGPINTRLRAAWLRGPAAPGPLATHSVTRRQR